MKNYLIILTILITVGYINSVSKSEYKYTVNGKKNLVVEAERAELTGDLTSEYLTDSKNFRLYIGSYNEYDEKIITQCKGDSIIVEKLGSTSATADGSFRTVIESHTYSIKALKKKHIFE